MLPNLVRNGAPIPSTCLRHTRTALLIKSLSRADRYPYKILRRGDERVLDQFAYLLDALEAWVARYAR